jgi:3-methyladenine DNA glycosylase AlkD
MPKRTPTVVGTVPERIAYALAWLEKHGTAKDRAGMARYGIVAKKAYGVPMSKSMALAKDLGRDHALALALWKTGWYEARLLATMVDEPEKVTPAQMDLWAKQFENWADCDTACFKLFDRTPHAWGRIDAWAKRDEEFVKRGAFALLASVALHDKEAPDAPFVKRLKLVERAATDDRNFVKKGVSWALRGVGLRNPRLRVAASAVAKRLAASEVPAARWVGRDALREFAKPRRTKGAD